MGFWKFVAAGALALEACAQRGVQDPAVNAVEQDPPAPSTLAAAGWDLQSSGEGVALALVSTAGGTTIRLFCPAGHNRLLVNVPAFKPIGSEERLSFGSGNTVIALVADPKGDVQRGGVTGSAPIPDELKRLIIAPISASYGAQQSGPHAPPPDRLAGPFLAACSDALTASRVAASKPTPATSPCLVQDGELLRMSPLRAIGTEPFWGARIEGRCVTYSHPEDQKGTRVWTRYSPGPDGGIWIGALGGSRFELRTRTAAACSDGMSDERYPFAVTLTVNGEERTGCAEPLKK